MKKLKVVALLFGILLFMLACSGGDGTDRSYNLLGVTMCTYRDGQSTCDGAKGDLAEGSSTVVSYAWGRLYREGSSYSDEYVKGLTGIDITLTLTVEGDGKAMASFETPDGRTVSVEATKDNPGVITDMAKLIFEKHSPSDTQEWTETAYVEVTVASVDGPVAGVQADFVVND
jgi:hypothetical protein